MALSLADFRRAAPNPNRGEMEADLNQQQASLKQRIEGRRGRLPGAVSRREPHRPGDDRRGESSSLAHGQRRPDCVFTRLRNERGTPFATHHGGAAIDGRRRPGCSHTAGRFAAACRSRRRRVARALRRDERRHQGSEQQRTDDLSLPPPHTGCGVPHAHANIIDLRGRKKL